MTTAVAWIADDVTWQLRTFASTGKRPRLLAPKRALFASDAEHAAALAGRLYVCDKPQHEGERALPQDRLYASTKTCKVCHSREVQDKKRRQREAAGVVRPCDVVYDTAEAFMSANAKERSDMYPDMIGNCPMPKREQFASTLEFDRACAMRAQHTAEYRRQYRARDDVKERGNAQARNKYATKKLTEEGRTELLQKTKRDQENKQKRLAALREASTPCCLIGPHPCTEADLTYDVVADLGITDYGGKAGTVRHGICRAHFQKAHARGRRHEASATRQAYFASELRTTKSSSTGCSWSRCPTSDECVPRAAWCTPATCATAIAACASGTAPTHCMLSLLVRSSVRRRPMSTRWTTST
jgi:hypothetical protein